MQMMFWFLDYFLLSSMSSITPINTPFIYTSCPYKTQFSSPPFTYPRALAPPPPSRTSSASLLLALAPHGRRPLLLSVSCLTWARLPFRLVSSSPVKDRARGWRGRPQSGLPHWIRIPSSPPWWWLRWRVALPSQSPLKPLWRWQRWCDTVRRWRGCN
jgi:hypothetical protein